MTSLPNYKVGDEYPVWWETFDKRPDGQHKAQIISITPYKGIFSFRFVLKLTAPTTKKGWLEMTVE